MVDGSVSGLVVEGGGGGIEQINGRCKKDQNKSVNWHHNETVQTRRQTTIWDGGHRPGIP